MKKEAKEKHFLKHPQYIGGKDAMREFIRTHLVYPEKAKEKHIEGKVRVRYTIDKHGAVIKTKVLTRLGYGCDEEAVRIVKLLKFHVPKNHMKVIFHKTTTINFRLKKLKKQEPQKQQPTQIQFVYTSKKETKDKGNSSYNYTISY